jgi:glyoxylase-like metal-dependent hydrolase (beta-lactamase superfamily II)
MTETLTSLTGLDATAPEPLPFAPNLHVRAFVLRRARGDVLVYAAPGMRELGDVSRWYLNHRHEAMFAGDGVDAPLFVHERDRDAVDLPVRGTFSRRHVLDEDLEVIPTPGHTPGATAYLWDSGEHRFLFTGDTIYLVDGEWVAAVLGSSDREAYLESLELIRGLEFDVLVPWAASAGQPYHAVTSAAGARRRIDAIIDRVRRGASR